jgi:hypothetical protein
MPWREMQSAPSTSRAVGAEPGPFGRRGAMCGRKGASWVEGSIDAGHRDSSWDKYSQP